MLASLALQLPTKELLPGFLQRSVSAVKLSCKVVLCCGFCFVISFSILSDGFIISCKSYLMKLISLESLR